MLKHKGQIIAEKDQYNVIDCSICGFIHLDPIPSVNEIEEYYKIKYFQKNLPQTLDVDKEKSDLPWSKLWFQDKLQFFNNYVKNEQKKLLDVGCGNGFFLEFMSYNNWITYGIEPSLKASEYAYTLSKNIYNTTLERFYEEKWFNYFDVLHLNGVLEHVRNPKRILEICRNLLKDKGILYLEVPNDFNLFQMNALKLNNPLWWVVIPDHIYYFNFDSLKSLVESLNFEIKVITTDFPMEIFILMGENYINNGEIGSICHQRRMNFEFNIPSEKRKEIYNSLMELGIGRSCIIFAMKK